MTISKKPRKKRRRKGDITLIPMLAAGATIKDCIKASGLSERTIYRRLTDFTFMAEVEALRRQWIDASLGILTEAATRAARILVEIADDVEEAGYVRTGAAKAIFQISSDLRLEITIVERIERIEQIVEERAAIMQRWR